LKPARFPPVEFCAVRWFGGGGHLVLFVFEPVAVAFEHDGVGVEDEAVDHGFDGDSGASVRGSPSWLGVSTLPTSTR
jgi:hypothetical protein